jgi:hypothetical protein
MSVGSVKQPKPGLAAGCVTEVKLPYKMISGFDEVAAEIGAKHAGGKITVEVHVPAPTNSLTANLTRLTVKLIGPKGSDFALLERKILRNLDAVIRECEKNAQNQGVGQKKWSNDFEDWTALRGILKFEHVATEPKGSRSTVDLALDINELLADNARVMSNDEIDTLED